MALRRSVLQEDDILSEMYADTRSDVSDYSDNESLDSDSDVPTTSSHKQRVLFREIPFSDELLDYLYAVSEVKGSGAWLHGRRVIHGSTLDGGVLTG